MSIFAGKSFNNMEYLHMYTEDQYQQTLVHRKTFFNSVSTAANLIN